MDIIKTSDFFCEKGGCLGNGSGWSTSTCLYWFYCKQALQCMKDRQKDGDQRVQSAKAADRLLPPPYATGATAQHQTYNNKENGSVVGVKSHLIGASR